MKTAMQELRDDLVETLKTGNEALNEIKDKSIRESCQKVVQLTLESIIKRIDEELLEMEKEQQDKFTIDFINWLHLNQYKYNPKAKLYQKHFINETLFFSIDELFITFKQQEQ